MRGRKNKMLWSIMSVTTRECGVCKSRAVNMSFFLREDRDATHEPLAWFGRNHSTCVTVQVRDTYHMLWPRFSRQCSCITTQHTPIFPSIYASVTIRGVAPRNRDNTRLEQNIRCLVALGLIANKVVNCAFNRGVYHSDDLIR